MTSAQNPSHSGAEPTVPVATSEPVAPATPDIVADVLELSQVDLYQVFRRAPLGEIPRGRGRGTPIALPGTAVAAPLARFFGTVGWRGKVFRPDSGDLSNLISVFGIPMIRARVYRQESWFDGRECIVLDYGPTSRLFGWVRDEIREVRPGMYLGLVYGVGRFFGGRRLLDVAFVLSFPSDDPFSA